MSPGFRLVVGAALLTWPAVCPAAPRWVRVSLTEDPAHAMFVSWNTDGAAESIVQYGPDSSYGSEATGTSDDMGGDLGVVHAVRIEGLAPDTTYHYRAGSAADGWSDDKVFSTAPVDVCAPFSFGIAADNRADGVISHGTSLCWTTVYDAIAAAGVDFVINTGDLVEEGESRDEWADFLEKSDAWMGEVPIMGAIGNHDDDEVEGDGANYNRVLAMPRNSANQTEDFYSFDYGNVHFACLSTDSFTGNHLETQLAWLEQDLAATDKMWKVVYFHVPIYSSGSHGTDEDGNNAYLIPVFDAHHVDLVLTGHDHIYERYRPMYGGQEVASYDQGTCYMVSGGGGAPTDPIYDWRAKEDGLEMGDGKHHFVKVTVTNNVMHIRAERVSGSGCLQGGTGVIDEFDIVKTLADDPCQGPTDADGDGVSPPGDCCDAGNETVPGCTPDTAAQIHPGAEDVCGDGIDQNCDGRDEPCPCPDGDADGYQDATCVEPGQPGDCDDADPRVHPGAPEICDDGIDNDCDGETDEADCGDCQDADGDGYFGSGPQCPDGNDCDDGAVDVNPGALEDCNGVDDDCDGLTDEEDVCGTGDCVDVDGDGSFASGASCPAGDDCDDADPDVHPGALEACNGVDDDCDGDTDEDLGTSTCGVGACLHTVDACVDGQDNPCTPLPRPEESEQTCDDGIDNDCDGWADADDDDCEQDPGGGTSSGCGCGSQELPSNVLFAVLLFGVGLIVCRRRQAA